MSDCCQRFIKEKDQEEAAGDEEMEQESDPKEERLVNKRWEQAILRVEAAQLRMPASSVSEPTRLLS